MNPSDKIRAVPPRAFIINCEDGCRHITHYSTMGIEYLSKQEHEALLAAERARSAKLVEALKEIGNSNYGNTPIDNIAYKALAAYAKKEGEEGK